MLKRSVRESKKYHKSVKVIALISFLMIFVFSSAISVQAFERPEIKDGLTEKWHPGAFCIPCHYTLLNAEKARTISNGCSCHDFRPANAETKYKVEMKKIFDIHKDIVCIRCHVGVKEGINVTAADFHRIMSEQACLTCHTYDNGTIQKPAKTRCSDCHSGDPHVVHGKRLERMCETCHGEFARTYAGTKMVSTSPAKQDAVKEYPTFGQIISNIIGSILQIFR